MYAIRKVLNKKVIFSLRSIRSRTLSSEAVNFNILKSDYEYFEIPNVTLPEVLFASMEKYPKHVVVECGITGKRYTAEQVRKKCFNLSRALRRKLKLGKGDVVAVCLPNCPDFPVATIGIMAAGMVVTTMNPIYTPEEISKQLVDSQAKAIITQNTFYHNVQGAMVLTKKHIPIVTVKEKEYDSLPEGAINFEEMIQLDADDLPEIVSGQGSDLAFLPYSSGTTGLPKGVELRHFNLVANLIQMLHPEHALYSYPSGHDQDVVPMVLPMYHIYGFFVGIANSLARCAKVVTLPRFTPETFISVLKNQQVTRLLVVPPLVLFLSSNAGVKPEYLQHVKSINSGAAPLAHSDEHAFKEKFKKYNLNLRQMYGLTETAPMVSTIPNSIKGTDTIAGSIGRILPNMLAKIIAPNDPAGTPLGPNEEGELLLKGPQIMERYLNKPGETEIAFLDGWFRTGDLAYYNEDKFIFIADRLKELIKVSGFQVPPAELEALIRTHPSVLDVAVIGIPHPTRGEVPKAYVVPKEKNMLKPEEVQEYVASRVAKYKHLAGGVQILDDIPKTQSGKILRRNLKKQYQKEKI